MPNSQGIISKPARCAFKRSFRHVIMLEASGIGDRTRNPMVICSPPYLLSYKVHLLVQGDVMLDSTSADQAFCMPSDSDASRDPLDRKSKPIPGLSLIPG